MKRKLITMLLTILCVSASAQLHIGAFGNVNLNLLSYDKGYYGNLDAYSDETQKEFKNWLACKVAGGFYLSFRYDFNSFLALRTDLECQFLCSKDLCYDVCSDGIYTYGKITYRPSLLLPVMGCVYLSKGRWNFYECPGFYGGYNIDDRIAYKNWDFGFVNCVGVGIGLGKNCSINAEVKYYRGFLNQHETGSMYFKQPMYNQFVEFSVGLTYTIDLKK